MQERCWWGLCVTTAWRHQAIFGSGSSISKKLSQEAPWHLDLASDPCHCGQVQADLTDSWDPRTVWKLCFLDLRGQLASEFFLRVPVCLQLGGAGEGYFRNICINSGKLLKLESQRGRALKLCPHQQYPLAPTTSEEPLKFGLGENESFESIPWSWHRRGDLSHLYT